MPAPIRSLTQIETAIFPVPIVQIWPRLEPFDSINARADNPKDVQQYLNINTRNWQITKKWGGDILNELHNLRRDLALAINALFDAFGHGYKVPITLPVVLVEPLVWYNVAIFNVEIVEPCTFRIFHTFRLVNPRQDSTITMRWAFRGGTKDTIYQMNERLALSLSIFPAFPPLPAPPSVVVVDEGQVKHYPTSQFQYTSFDIPYSEPDKIPRVEIEELRLQIMVDLIPIPPLTVPGVPAPLPEYQQYVDGVLWIDIVKPTQSRKELVI